MFITFEGGEGVGKSIQAKLLVEFLKSIGKEVILTREPGGTDLAEEIRSMLLTGDPEKITPITESLLYLSARSDHWIRKIKPALNCGNIVICDRFQDSSLVYQGICKGLSLPFLNHVFHEFTNGEKPNRTYLIDLDPRIGVTRSLSRENNTETRFEKMDIVFHDKVRNGFLHLAKEDPARFLIIDGSLPIKDIQAIIREDVRTLI